jgi:hypothetical protein
MLTGGPCDGYRVGRTDTGVISANHGCRCTAHEQLVKAAGCRFQSKSWPRIGTALAASLADKLRLDGGQASDCAQPHSAIVLSRLGPGAPASINSRGTGWASLDP